MAVCFTRKMDAIGGCHHYGRRRVLSRRMRWQPTKRRSDVFFSQLVYFVSPKHPSLNLQLLCNQAVMLHQRGQLAEAERLCLLIHAADPANFTASHVLGVIRLQQGRNADALALIRAVLKAKPDAVGVLLTYGLVLQTFQRFDEALASFDKALMLKPNFAEALVIVAPFFRD